MFFGTSIAKYIQSKQLGFRGRKMVTMFQSGSKIKDVEDNVHISSETNETALSDDIEKGHIGRLSVADIRRTDG